MIRFLLTFLFCVCQSAVIGQEEALPPELSDIDEVTLTDAMIELGTLPTAENLLKVLGYRLQIRANERVHYSKICGGQGAMFSLRKVSMADRRLAKVSFTTTTPSMKLRQALVALGYRQTEVSEKRVEYQKDSIEVVMTGDRLLPTFTVSFYINRK